MSLADFGMYVYKTEKIVCKTALRATRDTEFFKSIYVLNNPQKLWKTSVAVSMVILTTT